MQSDEIVIRTNESEYRLGFVSSEPVLKNTQVGFILTIGNTGFEYKIEKDQNGEIKSRFEFQPENQVGTQEKNGVIYARILGLSLLETRSWLLNNKNVTVNGIKLDTVPPIVIKSTTNFDLINSLYNLFSNHGNHDRIITAYENDIDLQMDMDAFIKLSNDDPVILFLKKITHNIKEIQIHHTVQTKDLE